ncbi:MAG: M14-type cytosolic carboxypeptidase [Planctomycetia bacterium]|nr:M14-type cytosolic carboxypeptidase [Planctomycetia bacterium]
MNKYFWIGLCFLGIGALAEEVRFSADFPGGSVGKIEKAGENVYRIAMPRQCDEKRLNTQSTWFAFRMENVSGPTTLIFHDFDAVYNGRPTRPRWLGQCPVYSTDGDAWTHVPPENSIWDDERRTLSVTVPAVGRTVWVAYTALYVQRHWEALKTAVADSPNVRMQEIGKSLEGRPIVRFTVTDFAVPEAGKKRFYILARQHAWEAHTSWQADGMIRFLISDAGAKLRQKGVFYVIPIVDGDGVEHGRIRFNGNGYDVNRRWNEVDVTKTKMRDVRPEVWYVKKDILDEHARLPLDLVVNLHNDTHTDYIDAAGDRVRDWPKFRAIEKALAETPFYDPNANHPITIFEQETAVPSTFDLWWGHRVPTLMIEQKINRNRKTGTFANVPDSQARGAEFLKILMECWASTNVPSDPSVRD